MKRTTPYPSCLNPRPICSLSSHDAQCNSAVMTQCTRTPPSRLSPATRLLGPHVDPKISNAREHFERYGTGNYKSAINGGPQVTKSTANTTRKDFHHRKPPPFSSSPDLPNLRRQVRPQCRRPRAFCDSWLNDRPCGAAHYHRPLHGRRRVTRAYCRLFLQSSIPSGTLVIREH